jgi:transcription elongation factor GreA
MQQRFRITREGFNKLKSRLDELVQVDGPATSKAIGEAIALGDLKENAEFSSSMERLRMIEGMISLLSERISVADIVDITKLSGDVVDFGATVYLVDEDTDKKVKFTLLSEYEADSEKNIISIESPIGRALIGKKVGDSVEIRVPSGIKNFEVLDIKWQI